MATRGCAYTHSITTNIARMCIIVYVDTCISPIAYSVTHCVAFIPSLIAISPTRLTTQPPGPVILLGHSMGGLLVADAATDPSNKGQKRIVGMIAFDCPYIGMHPHVVISGIASLFAKKDKEDDKTEDRRGGMDTERRMNEGEVGEEGVHMVNENVTDDWERFKRESRMSRFHSRSSYSLLSGGGVFTHGF